MNKYASRKFILAISGLAVSTVLVWYGKVGGAEFVALNSILGGAFMAADTIIKRANDSP